MISYVLFFPNFFAPVAPLFAKSSKLGRSKVSTGDSAVLGAIPGMSLGWSNCCKLAMKGSSNMLDVFIGKKGRFAAIQGTFTHLQYIQYTRIIKKRLIYISLSHIRLTSYFTDMTSDCTYTHDIIVGAFCYFLIFVTVFLVVTYDIVSGVTWKHILTTCCFIIVNQLDDFMSLCNITFDVIRLHFIKRHFWMYSWKCVFIC